MRAENNEETPEYPLSRFMDVYTNLPPEERDKTVVIINDEPINWHMARRNIENKTPLGKKTGKKLIEQEII
ncbi:MAG: hypothetical protein ABEJ56_01500 [Candidatus Nanohaloarchaea archaeon]